ncbi:MAG: hypothetical protein KDJ29_15435 [Hyphomicrobiales bacterium]|nr:hypothetical protein [Hyphomicrobiales bacterium]
MIGNITLKSTLAIAAGALLVSQAPASAQGSAEAFYKGKNVSMIIGYPPGGGYDRYGRTVARHIGKHIPGKPSIIVKNMPGAGSLVFANYLYNVAPKDGAEFGIFAGGIAMDALIGGKKTRFDSRKFTWLGSANESTSACFAWHDAKVNTLADLMKTELVVGASSGGSSTFAWPTAMNNVLGTKFKIVAGYPGSKSIILAMEKGEVKGLCGYFLSSIRSVRPKWLPEKKVKLLVLEAVKPHKDFPNVKTVMDYARTEDDRKILNIVFGWQVMGRPFAAPPGIPADRARALREAFWKTMKDPAFLADAKKVRIQIEPRTYKQVQDYLDEAWKTPKPLVKKVFVALGRDRAKKKKK